MLFCDAHIHLAEIVPADADLLCAPHANFLFCACAHSESDFLILEKRHVSNNFVRSFGIHPQNPDEKLVPFLELLLNKKRVDAIGEAGFDVFSAEYASQIVPQKVVWNVQLELARTFSKPLIVHCRRALDRIFCDATQLKKLPAVIFHSWSGSPQEATALLKRGINAYFSLGKPLLNGKKSALLSCEKLPFERLLAETDAPYQTLKGETYTKPSDIALVYQKIANVRGIALENLAIQLQENFYTCFKKH